MDILQTTQVVIPCYNEAKRLDLAAFERALAAQPKLAFIFVNDGSTDNTLAVLRGFQNRHPTRISVLSLDKNSGKGEAVRCGMLQGMAQRASYVGYWDADLATGLEYIAEFANVLDHSDSAVVFGSRVRLAGYNIERRGLRHYVGRLFATFAAATLRYPIYDTQCGAKLFRNLAAVRAVFETPFLTRWCFDVEIFARLLARKRQVGDITFDVAGAEFPLRRWVDVGGSKLSVRHGPQIGLEMLKIAKTLRATPRRTPSPARAPSPPGQR